MTFDAFVDAVARAADLAPATREAGKAATWRAHGYVARLCSLPMQMCSLQLSYGERGPAIVDEAFPVSITEIQLIATTIMAQLSGPDVDPTGCDGGTLKAAVAAGVVSLERASSGLTKADVDRLIGAGYGGVEVLIRYRTGDFDDRQTLTLLQVAQLPLERQEMIRSVSGIAR